MDASTQPSAAPATASTASPAAAAIEPAVVANDPFLGELALSVAGKYRYTDKSLSARILLSQPMIMILGGHKEVCARFPNSERDATLTEAGKVTTQSTASLAESITEYGRIHGRTYTQKADYWGPNDEQQNEGLDLA
ncbi:UMTA [Colletotrichum cuscutae]|uniref:UMTA n=1 Tax=Colletotrichum cuscutae TaxID=1209917 RepID=A0AAI9YAX3_9PEZI|nr:UMTA [Colletotrichum cuscutae]